MAGPKGSSISTTLASTLLRWSKFLGGQCWKKNQERTEDVIRGLWFKTTFIFENLSKEKKSEQIHASRPITFMNIFFSLTMLIFFHYVLNSVPKSSQNPRSSGKFNMLYLTWIRSNKSKFHNADFLKGPRLGRYYFNHVVLPIYGADERVDGINPGLQGFDQLSQRLLS